MVKDGQWASLLLLTSLLVMMELSLCIMKKEIAKGINCHEYSYAVQCVLCTCSMWVVVLKK